MSKLVVKLRSKVRARAPPVPVPQDVPQTPQQKHAAYMRNYRSKFKKNREQYQMHRRLETDWLRAFRERMTAEQRRRQNELSRLRMQKMRKKSRATGQQQSCLPNVPNTRSAEERRRQQREYWKMKKRQQRAAMSSQKKRRIREKDAAQKRASYSARQRVRSIPVILNKQPDEGFPSDAARRKAISRARKVLPKGSAEKFAEVVAGVIRTSDKKGKDAMEKKGITADDSRIILQSIRDTCNSLKGRRKRYFVSQMSSFLDKQHGLKTKASRQLNIGWKYLMKYSRMKKHNVNVEERKKRADAVSTELVEAVQEFYQHPNVSTEMPNKKGLRKGAEKPKFVLQKTLQQTYNQFCDDQPNPSISQSKFAQLRPHNVLVQGKAKVYQCLCEYCTNINLKIKAVNKVASERKLDCIVVDCYQLSALTLCPQDDGSKLAKLPCIDRECDQCGIKLLDSFFKPLLDVAGDSQLSWQRWGKLSVTSDKGGKNRVGLLRVSGSVANLIEEVKGELQTFSTHLFEARWQQSCFYSICKNPPEETVVLVMDFAENYSCLMQHEVQSAHWYIAQITMHPMVAYYTCNCGDPMPVRESIHIISDDMQHDAHAVQKYTSLAANHLTGARGLKPMRLIKFSDGCGAQYKSKIPFVDLSHSSSDLGIPSVEHHFFGSRHGKNPCDGEGGIVKNAATRAVKAGTDIINSAESLFLFCSQHLSRPATNENGCNHSRRVFFLVRKGDIQRERPERTEVSSVAGTRKVHAVVGVKPYLIKKRRLSCFCSGCNTGGKCDNANYTSPWTEAILKLKERRDESSVVQSCTTVDFAESEVVAVGEFQQAVLKDLFRDVHLCENESPDQCRTSTPATSHHPLVADSVPSCTENEEPIAAEKVSPQARGIKMQLDSYYAVFYDNEFYVGRLTNFAGDNFTFKFLHRVRSVQNNRERLYDWPARSDCEVVHGNFIINGPLKLHGSGPFTIEGLEHVDALFLKMKNTQKEL